MSKPDQPASAPAPAPPPAPEVHLESASETPVISTAATPARPLPPESATLPARAQTVVYEDDDVLVEWSVRTPPTDTIAVTFDPILVAPSQPAYAAAFLHKTGADTLCVRKKSEHFYQPLTRERFDEVTRPVLAQYARRLAYGSSLGAYAVLYFCRHGFETVISSSPRVSAHPRFGRPHWQARAPFRHATFDAAEPATSGAVVFYDPYDAMDRDFVDHGLRHGWPQAAFIAVPYAGHPANQFLSEIGYIAPFVHAVVSRKALPVLERRKHKARSFTYRHMLASACLRHGKAPWGERLCRQALQMKPDLVGVKLTLGRALVALGRLDEAEPTLHEFLQKYPEDGDAQQALRAIARERKRLKSQRAAVAVPRPPDSPDPEAAGTTRWVDRLGLAALWLTGRLRLTVTHDDIAWCYRHVLGRAPESTAALLAHRRSARFDVLAQAFLLSPEFIARANHTYSSAELDRLLKTACLARRVLPLHGRLLNARSTEEFRVALGGQVHEVSLAQQMPASVDLCMNAETLLAAPAQDDTQADTQTETMVAALIRLLKPGGYLLLATAQNADTPLTKSSVIQGLTVLEHVPLKGGACLTLARKPRSLPAAPHRRTQPPPRPTG